MSEKVVAGSSAVGVTKNPDLAKARGRLGSKRRRPCDNSRHQGQQYKKPKLLANALQECNPSFTSAWCPCVVPTSTISRGLCLPDPISIGHGRASGTSPYSTTNATTSTTTSIVSPRARLVARSRRSDARPRRGAGLGTVWASATCPALGPSAASSRTRGLRRMGSRRCLRVDRRLPATPSSFRVHDRHFRRPIAAIVQARRPRRRPQTRPGGPPRRLAAHKP